MIYLTNNLSPKMLQTLVEGESLVKGKTYAPDYLRGIEDFKACITNDGLKNRMGEILGFDLEEVTVPRISLKQGDTLLLIKPTDDLKKFKNSSTVPDYIGFTLEEYTCE